MLTALPHWAELFRFSVSPLETVVRGSVTWWFVFLLFRCVLRRDVGSLGVADVLLVVLVADASQNAMAGDYKSITDGCLLVATLASWNLLLDWLSFRFPALQRLIEPPPLLLVRDGRLLRDNLRRELLSIDELKAKLRLQGIEHWSEVKRAYMESSGDISVIRK